MFQLALGAHLPRTQKHCHNLAHSHENAIDFDMTQGHRIQRHWTLILWTIQPFQRTFSVQTSTLVTGGTFYNQVFYKDQLLDLLKAAKEWYVDGTFKSVGAPFVQLWSIHVFISHGDSVKQVPVLYSSCPENRQK